jgi:hypothetical protein
MAIPIITDHFAAQVVIPSKTGLPEDGITNTFYFRNDWVSGAPYESIRDTLADFYNASQGAMRLTSYISSTVTSTPWLVKMYDLGTPAPRQPTTMDIPVTLSGIQSLPTEVTACGSFISNRNLPRQRGRIFVGPLNQSAAEVQAPGRVALNATFRATLLSAMAAMNSTTNNVSWRLYSPTDAAMKEVTGGWVDNAFDTQRRRGTAPTVREFWGNMVPAT